MRNLGRTISFTGYCCFVYRINCDEILFLNINLIIVSQTTWTDLVQWINFIRGVSNNIVRSLVSTAHTIRTILFFAHKLKVRKSINCSAAEVFVWALNIRQNEDRSLDSGASYSGNILRIPFVWWPSGLLEFEKGKTS